MTKGQRTIASLLAVVAVLLGLNLIVGGSPPAEAQGVPGGPLQPTVVGVSSEQIWISLGGPITQVTQHWRIVRAWSDGQVDVSRAVFESETSCVLISTCQPEVIIPGT